MTRAKVNAPVATDAAAAPKTQFHADIEELRGRLAAVVAATSDAANVIISGLEHVLADADAARPNSGALDALSACVFHDIVGQHVARAAELLEIIERLGPPEAAEAETPRARQGLASGPSLPQDEGLDQPAVDLHFRDLGANS